MLAIMQPWGEHKKLAWRYMMKPFDTKQVFMVRFCYFALWREVLAYHSGCKRQQTKGVEALQHRDINNVLAIY